MYNETQKLQVYADIQRYLDALASAEVAVCYARRNTKLVRAHWADKTPMPFSFIYVGAYPKGKEPKQFIVSRQVRFG